LSSAAAEALCHLIATGGSSGREKNTPTPDSLLIIFYELSRRGKFFNPANISKKIRYQLGTDNGFKIFSGFVVMPLSALSLAADKYLRYEEDNNNAYKVVNGT